MSLVNESHIRVRYQETDQMGVVYHANYLVWFEVGRTNLIRDLGVPYAKLEEMGLVLPVLEANVRYKAPAKYDDELVIRTTIGQLTPVKQRFEYEVYRPKDDRILTTGFSRHAFVDKQMKPFNLKKQKPEIYQMLESFYKGIK